MHEGPKLKLNFAELMARVDEELEGDAARISDQENTAEARSVNESTSSRHPAAEEPANLGVLEEQLPANLGEPEIDFHDETETESTAAIEVDETELTSGGIDKATRTQPRQPKPRGRANSAGTRSRGVGGNTKEKEKLPPDEDSVRQYLKEIGQYPLLTKEDEVRLAQKMEAGLAAKYRMESSDYLSPSELRKLRRAVRDGDRAKQQFINSNLRLVVSIAKKYQASGMPLLDLTQEGNFGLMHAVEKFDWQKGFKFSTYATWWIRQAITRGIANTGRTIRLPVHAGDTLKKIQKTRARLELQTGVAPGIEELSVELEMPPEKISEALRFAAEPLSLDDPLREDGDATLGDVVPDSHSSDGYDKAEAADTSRQVREVLPQILDAREFGIVCLRFGLNEEGEPRTLEEVGAHFNLTRERIRQIESRALTKLRHPAAGGLMSGLRDIG